MVQDQPNSRRSVPRPPHGGRERYDALQEFMEQHTETLERHAGQQPTSRMRVLGRIAVLAVLVAVFCLAWWKGNDWLGPAFPPRPTIVQLNGTLRLSLYLQAQRIKVFEDRTGHLPGRLDEAGPSLPGILYEKLDARTYRITGRNGDVTLSYRSDQPIGQLLDASVTRLGL
jgi:hypothetical protein